MKAAIEDVAPSLSRSRLEASQLEPSPGSRKGRLFSDVGGFVNPPNLNS